MTSASPADTKVTGAARGSTSYWGFMGDTLRKIGQPMLQGTETAKGTGNEECSE